MSTYTDLNAQLNLYGPDGQLQLHKDREAAHAYFLEYINANTQFFHDVAEKIEYLVENSLWDSATFADYADEFVKNAFRHAYVKKYRFSSFMGAYKFYSSYALRSNDGKTILERYEDRVVMTALTLARGDEGFALSLIDEIMSNRFQPATPTFQNAGKAKGGEMVSCFLIASGDSLDSIKYTWNSAAELSKLGGGVAINATNLRERGAPLKGKSGLAKGVVSWMKIYEDIFSTVDQLGTRPGAGAVYLSAHHPEIMAFLDCKRENADEKVRIKTLSTGVVIPDITIDLAKRGEDMYLFSPYDVEREYGRPFSDIDITAEYRALVDNPRIRKSKASARKLLQTIAELQFESGYPYILFSDTANRANPVPGVVSMSNLCSEILQTSQQSVFNEQTGQFDEVGRDISCNLGSMHVENTMSGSDFARTVDVAMRALTAVSDMTDIKRVPTVAQANAQMHSVGLGQMSLATFFATHEMRYGDEESLDFTNVYFALVNYHSLVTSNDIAIERGEVFRGFSGSSYADGSYFERYVSDTPTPRTEKVAKIFADAGISIPTSQDWAHLSTSVQHSGLYHAWRQAVPPTGSISYIADAAASIHPITSLIEIRKEGQLGRVYYPTPKLSAENMPYFEDAYQVGWKRLIDVYAEATKHVDQGLSCTLFFHETATTRDVNRAQLYAWSKGIKTLYYVRLRAVQIDGTESGECISCAL